MPIKEWGIPTLLEASGPMEAAALCSRLGLSFVELNMNLPEYQRWDLSALRKAGERYGTGFTIHLDENLDVCDFNPRVANAWLDTLLETIHVARRLHIPVLNMHLLQGVYFTLPEKRVYLYDMYREHFLGRLREAIARCEEAAEGEITLCIENTGVFDLPFLQEALNLFLQSPLFGLTFDVGHNHSAGDVDRSFILEHKNRLRHFHIHDAVGGKNHLPLGTGEIDLPGHLALAAEQNCRAVLEVKTVQALEQSVIWGREHGIFNM